MHRMLDSTGCQSFALPMPVSLAVWRYMVADSYSSGEILLLKCWPLKVPDSSTDTLSIGMHNPQGKATRETYHRHFMFDSGVSGNEQRGLRLPALPVSHVRAKQLAACRRALACDYTGK